MFLILIHYGGNKLECSEAVFLVVRDPSMNELWAT